MKIVIRRVDPTRYRSAIFDLYRDLMSTKDGFPETIDFAYIAYDEPGNVAGFATATIYPIDQAIYLNSAGVLRDYRGQGLQQRLIKRRCDDGRKVGCAWAYTYTRKFNHASSNNLIRSGFKLWTPAAWWGRRPHERDPWLWWIRKL